MAKIQDKYELLFIIDPNKTEEEIAALTEKFKALVEANGTIDEFEDWGKRRLAYEIEDRTEGCYEPIKFTCGPEFPAELKRILGITDGILRSLVVKAEG